MTINMVTIKAGNRAGQFGELSDSATQRDAMAVAEAVRDACAKLAMNAPIAADTQNDDGKATAWKASADIRHIDLAAIVEAVRPGRQSKPEAIVPDDIQAALVFSRNFATVKPGIGLAEKEHILGLANLLERVSVQLASAQQKGEPVAWRELAENITQCQELVDRIGPSCTFEGQGMIYASYLEEWAEKSRAMLAAAPKPEGGA